MNVQRLLQNVWGNEHGPNDFRIFGILHIVMIIILLIIVGVMYARRDRIRERNSYRKIEVAIGVTLFMQQFLMYAWYGTYFTTLSEVLPLYLCRITILCTSYTLITGRYKLLPMIYFWGSFGSFLALIFVDTSGFGFPHIMFFSFFVGHGGLALAIFYFVSIKGYQPSSKDFYKMLLWNVVYIVVACVVNKLVDGNYNYLEEKPFMLPIPDSFVNTLYYKLTILGVFQLLTGIVYLPVLVRRRKQQKRYEENNFPQDGVEMEFTKVS